MARLTREEVISDIEDIFTNEPDKRVHDLQMMSDEQLEHLHNKLEKFVKVSYLLHGEFVDNQEMEISGSSSDGDEKVVFSSLIHGDEIELVLDQKECIPSDPGAGHPAMVQLTRGRETEYAPIWCCLDYQSMDPCDNKKWKLSKYQINWLDDKMQYVDSFLAKWTAIVEEKEGREYI